MAKQAPRTYGLVCSSPGGLLPDILDPTTLEGWRSMIGCTTPSSILLLHLLMVMIFWVPNLMERAMHTALLQRLGTQEPQVLGTM